MEARSVRHWLLVHTKSILKLTNFPGKIFKKSNFPRKNFFEQVISLSADQSSHRIRVSSPEPS